MPTCTYALSGTCGRAMWSCEATTLQLLPDGGAPIPIPLCEIASLSGDGYELCFSLGQEKLTLSKLGADGQSLSEQLWRIWPPLRAEALRLAGTGQPQRFAGKADLGAGAVRCVVLLYGEVLLAFPEGGDAHPLFLALQKSVQYDADNISLTLRAVDGNAVRFSHFGGAMDRFVDAVTTARGALGKEASDVLARSLPSLGVAQRTLLSGAWLPGHFRPVSELNALVAGLRKAMELSWIAACPRAREYAVLCERVPEEGLFLAHLSKRLQDQGGTGEAEASDIQATPGGGPDAAQALPPSDAAPTEAPAPLWLLARRPSGWALEALAEDGRATYRFSGDAGVADLCSRLLCAPQFSREALYQPLEKLVGEKALYATPARELVFLRELRGRFQGRVLHHGLDAWRQGLG